MACETLPVPPRGLIISPEITSIATDIVVSSFSVLNHFYMTFVLRFLQGWGSGFIDFMDPDLRGKKEKKMNKNVTVPVLKTRFSLL
jgi:hypothetical protein